MVANIAREIDHDRFEMEVVCTRGEGPLAEPVRASGVPVKVVALPSAKRLERYMTPLQVLKALRAFKPDVVHSHALPAMIQVGPLAMLRQAPRWIHTFHFGNYPYPNSSYMTVERIFSGSVDQLVAVSEPQREIVIKHHRIRTDRIVTIPNGVNEPPLDNGCVTGAQAR